MTVFRRSRQGGVADRRVNQYVIGVHGSRVSHVDTRQIGVFSFLGLRLKGQILDADHGLVEAVEVRSRSGRQNAGGRGRRIGLRLSQYVGEQHRPVVPHLRTVFARMIGVRTGRDDAGFAPQADHHVIPLARAFLGLDDQVRLDPIVLLHRGRLAVERLHGRFRSRVVEVDRTAAVIDRMVERRLDRFRVVRLTVAFGAEVADVVHRLAGSSACSGRLRHPFLPVADRAEQQGERSGANSRFHSFRFTGSDPSGFAGPFRRVRTSTRGACSARGERMRLRE